MPALAKPRTQNAKATFAIGKNIYKIHMGQILRIEAHARKTKAISSDFSFMVNMTLALNF
jgi:DNA-binding LytR/AlgR family response regulator